MKEILFNMEIHMFEQLFPGNKRISIMAHIGRALTLKCIMA